MPESVGSGGRPSRNWRREAASENVGAHRKSSANAGNGGNPSCMRPCPAVLNDSPRSREPHRDRRFGSSSGGRPVSREPQRHPREGAGRQPFNGTARLYEVVQVRLARTQRLVEVSTGDFKPQPGTSVLVRVHRNVLLATTSGHRYRRVADIGSLPFIVRNATERDVVIDRENAIIEKRAQSLASAYAIEHGLQMKVLSADLSHDHKNITVNFASDVRVDFREMVTYLSSGLGIRVEMYQLGLRNGTGLICGLGSCGQLLCCGRFLGQFDPIAVRQLRAQGLAANPKRISGVCGRLYCCMSYEYCEYMREQRAMPRKGRRVFTRWGVGRITDIDTLREDLTVTYENGEIQRVTRHDFLPLTDEISEAAASGDMEFPLEPARFWLNGEPGTADRAESASGGGRGPGAHGPRRRNIGGRNAAGESRRPVVASRGRAASGEHAHARRVRVSHPQVAVAPQSGGGLVQAESSSEPQGQASGAVRPIGGRRHASKQHSAEMPKKVRAGQANITDERDVSADGRHRPQKSSWRRFRKPLSPDHGGGD